MKRKTSKKKIKESEMPLCRFKGYCGHKDCKKGTLEDPETRKSHNRELLSLMIAHQLVELGREGKLKQTELAAKIGVVSTYVSALEHGSKIASIPLLLEIADIFGKKLSVKFI